ncbi:MAG: Asp-tRNA(Asn)/Glu-tRNA(Gln) amidotransferase subunit GatB, partial [Rhodoferax sp.]
IVSWIGISDGNMQEGSFRCDANVSVRKPGAPLGTRREIKNLNSFKNMQQAMDYEIRWQIEQLEDGQAIEQATVLFNPDTGETRAMRTKEDAADYRYFPDPDLPPLVIAPEWVGRVRSEMTELPRLMAQRYISDYGLSDYDAGQLTQSKAMAAYFEAVEKDCGQAKLANNWITGEVSKWLNAVEDHTFEEFAKLVPARNLAALIVRIADNTISNSAGRIVFTELTHTQEAMFDTALAYVDSIIEAKGLKQMSDSGALDKIIDDVLAANSKSVEEFRAGKDKAFNALVGQVMKASRGKANPSQVNDLLRKKLG